MFRNKYFTLAQLLGNERRSAEELVEIQNRKLRRLVHHAYDRFCKAQYLRPYVSNGRGLFDTAMRFSSASPRYGKWFQRFGILREFHVLNSLRGVEMLETHGSVNPDVLIGYPSAILTLAEALLATGKRSHLPRIVFTDSELLTDFARDRIRIEEFAVTVSPRHDLTSADYERIANAVRVSHPKARVSVRAVAQGQPRPPGKQRIFVSRIQ